MKYKALIVEEKEGGFQPRIGEKRTSDLEKGDVLIRVRFSALNYKDALSTNGHKGITRNYPHTPGVDASGEVVEDSSNTYSPGTKVICTSYDLGMNVSGGFGEYIRVPVEWVVPLPKTISLKDSMILGTAGYTAGLALYKMELCGQTPKMGKIIVTGASGGVGSMATAILVKAGYDVIASTGKKESHAFLKQLGACGIVGREEVNDQTSRVLTAPKWAGAIDNVGGNTLSTLIKSCGRNGSIASIGLVGSDELITTVYPFILNGINLLGIDSAETPNNIRRDIWERISTSWKPESLDEICTLISLSELIPYLKKVLKGQSQGRIVLQHD